MKTYILKGCCVAEVMMIVTPYRGCITFDACVMWPIQIDSKRNTWLMGSRWSCRSSAELWCVMQSQRCVWPCCSWQVATAARLESNWTPFEPWSSGRGTCCRRTGACGGRAWTWRWVAPPFIRVKSHARHRHIDHCHLASSTQLYQCMSDLECREGSYCHTPAKGPAHSRCQACRRKKRRCHRDGMCCPGSRCNHSKTCLFPLKLTN